MLVVIMLAFIAVPGTVSSDADAYSYYNTTTTLMRQSGYLYNYQSRSFRFTLSSESEINLYFTSSTDGYYRVEIINSSGNSVYYDTDYSYSDNYVTLSKGSYTMYLTENDGDELQYDFFIYRSYNRTIKTTKASISRKKLKLDRYSSYYLYGSYSPSNSTQSGSWKSSKPSVATVSSDGYVYARNFGKTTITYKHGGKTAKCKVTVNKDYYQMGKGQSASFKSWMKKVKGYKKAKWSSTNSGKVSVNRRTGKIKARKGGQVTIKAKIKGTVYKIKVYSYDKKTLKKKTKAALKDALYVPSSLKIQTVKYPDFRHCKIYYSAKTLYGVRIYGAWMGYYSYGSFYSYKVF